MKESEDGGGKLFQAIREMEIILLREGATHG